METKTLNKKELINAKNANDLAAGVKQSIAQIERFISFNDYKLNKASIEGIVPSNLAELISKLSLSKRKELRNYLWRVTNHPSLETINRYLQFHMKNVIKSDERFKILKSDKHLSIEEKRAKYKQVLAIAKAAHADYKKEKGNFYKSRLVNGQKI